MAEKTTDYGAGSDPFDAAFKIWSAGLDGMRASILYWNGVVDRSLDFVGPMLRASEFFWSAEREGLLSEPIEDTLRDYGELALLNLSMAYEAWMGLHGRPSEYHTAEFRRFAQAILQTLAGADRETIDRYLKSKAEVLETLVLDLPKAVKDIGAEYGFHFETDEYRLVDRTDRMDLYEVLPTDPDVHTRQDAKPVIIAHPYVLGHNILAFLPTERKSYVHAFANQGIPTYVRIVRDISEHPAVQVMTGEDDALDTARFARLLKEKHGKPVTLSGVCQGGFLIMADALSGELDGLVDAVITNASPIDGTKSKGLRSYLDRIAPRFHSLAYALKTLPNGNRVVDGEVMSWVYKIKSLDEEAPVTAFYRDLAMIEKKSRSGRDSIGKTAAAINRWLVYDRTDLPVNITEMSNLSYSVPISPEGDLPVTLFGRTLNLKRLTERGIRLLICYGAQDDLVEPASALAPLDFIDAETTAFPKGHAAIFTSWSHPESEYALHKRYSDGSRGPVRFQLDLDEETSAA